MDQITDLRELLKHELKDLYSAEVQIIEGLPRMIEAAKNPQLKKALSEHLKVTEGQKKRLDEIEQVLNYSNDKTDENKGFFANLFNSDEGEQHCKAMEGLIKEADSLLKEDMDPQVLDAAIIAAAQKIEHYEIGSYGTARAYAEQMGLNEAEKLLRLTLDEEYFADNTLTKIAIDKVNIVAENGETGRTGSGSRKSNQGRARSNGVSSNNGNGKRTSNQRASGSEKSSTGSEGRKDRSTASKAPSKAAAKKGGENSNRSAAKKSAPKKSSQNRSAVKKSAPKKAVANKTAPKKSNQSRSTSKKAAPKKSNQNRSAAKKAAPKKTQSRGAAKKAAPNKSNQNRSSAKKAPAKKAAPKKSAAKKSAQRTAPKKGSSGNSARRGATKKSAPKKTQSKGRRR